MKRLVLLLAVVFCFCSVKAQQGIYGSFTLGQKIVDMTLINDSLSSMGLGNDILQNNYWIIGGDGYAILGNWFVLGGKGFTMWADKPVEGTAYDRVKLVGGLGIGYIGGALTLGVNEGFRIIPRVGVGMASFLLQLKEEFVEGGEKPKFSEALQDDYRSVLNKSGFAVDAGLAIDWYIEFIELKTILPGMRFGPMFHVDVGWTFVPGNFEWMRDFNENTASWHPDVKMEGFYANIGVGIGLATPE